LRYAIISDIHSNLEALSAVLSQIDTNQVDEIICLGDIVGYGPNPNECITLVKQNCSIIIAGNHDYACINESETEYFNYFAKQAIFWTIEHLTDESYKFLSSLRLDYHVENVYLVHASPENPSLWNYILSIEQAIYNFSYFENKICFIGHSHIPIVFSETEDNGYSISKETKFKINEDERYLINVGSVGQPRDLNSRAAYAVLDTIRNEYQLYRVTYNYLETQQKMVKNQLPQFLVDRLGNGR